MTKWHSPTRHAFMMSCLLGNVLFTGATLLTVSHDTAYMDSLYELLC